MSSMSLIQPALESIGDNRSLACHKWAVTALKHPWLLGGDDSQSLLPKLSLARLSLKTKLIISTIRHSLHFRLGS